VSYTSVIDGCAFHEWPSSDALLGYLDEGWRELVSPRATSFAINTHGQRMAYDPFLGPTPFMDPSAPAVSTVAADAVDNPAKADPGAAFAAGAADGVPGSDYAAFERDILDQPSVERVVLGYDLGLSSTSFVHRYFARDLTRAVNDWTVQEWLTRDDRLFGMVLVANSIPSEAAAEIRRVGDHPQMVAVALGCNGLSRPFGEPAYLPVLEAAAEMGLPIVVQSGADNASDQPSPPIASGYPSTYGEFRAHAPQAIWAHGSSLITEGVFNRFPTLKVLLMGAGAAWLPGWIWKMDYWFKMTAAAYPWMDRLPSEYLADHVRVSTHSLEAPDPPERLAQALGVIDDVEDLLVYTSGYPDEKFETAAQIADRLPPAWHERIFRTNAEELFRWPEQPVGASESSGIKTAEGDV
jgi:hypothetical protein